MPDAKLTLRDYRDDDISLILSLIKTAFSEQIGLVDPPSSAESKTIEIVRNELETANALVVEIDGAIAGCVFYQPKDESIYFDRLAVLPEFRRRGIGKLLIDEVEQRAKKEGYREMSLSVRIELVAQQKYYEAMNYKIVSNESHEGYSRPTYVVMRKTLTLTREH